jgi:hypothetical protein
MQSLEMFVLSDPIANDDRQIGRRCAQQPQALLVVIGAMNAADMQTPQKSDIAT